MHDEYGFGGPGPTDSSDMYMMGLRPPRCNGCKYARLKWELGDRFLSLLPRLSWPGLPRGSASTN